MLPIRTVKHYAYALPTEARVDASVVRALASELLQARYELEQRHRGPRVVLELGPGLRLDGIRSDRAVDLLLVDYGDRLDEAPQVEIPQYSGETAPARVDDSAVVIDPDLVTTIYSALAEAARSHPGIRASENKAA